MQVHVVTKWVNSQWPEDVCPEIVKVFKGTRVRAANKWVKDREKEHRHEYQYSVETWKVE